MSHTFFELGKKARALLVGANFILRGVVNNLDSNVHCIGLTGRPTQPIADLLPLLPLTPKSSAHYRLPGGNTEGGKISEIWVLYEAHIPGELPSYSFS